MIVPTQAQIDRVTNLLNASIQKLVEKDSNIFNIDFIMPQQISEDAAILNRELHETTINHRLAYYLERNIENTELSGHSVDIEYNRFYGNPKQVIIVQELVTVRPDIIIHGRINAQITPQHFLVVEAKKGLITDHDINKIKALISDDHYNYIFGFTISYCSNDEQVVGQLYYYNGDEIISIELNVTK